MATRKKKIEIVADPETCQTCRFFLMDSPKADAGYCRRYPPVFVESEEGAGFTQPVCALDDTCGEYRRLTN